MAFEDLTKIRWQFRVLLRIGVGKRHETWWNRIVKVFGLRAVVGHTAVGLFEHDRLMMPLTYIEEDFLLGLLITPESLI